MGDVRHQVFVSSTFRDLEAERQEVMQALLELDCIPAGMELFPAANEDQWTLIKKVIDDCDYYVVIVGGRYGSLGPEGLSYTEMEYRYAIDRGKPVIGFLHKDPGTLPANKCEVTDEGKVKLAAFRELVQTRHCKFWDSASDLGGKVSRGVVQLRNNNRAVGWVRGDDTASAEEVLRLRKRIESLEGNRPSRCTVDSRVIFADSGRGGDDGAKVGGGMGERVAAVGAERSEAA